MFDSDVTFGTDGSCRLTDAVMGIESSWATVEQWAVALLDEWRTEKYGEANDFIDAACHQAVPGVVGALIVLAETADGDADLLGFLGAGPLEDLVSHSGNGPRVLSDVDRAARQSPAFRAALRNVWLGPDVPEAVLTRLGELGARVLGQT